LSIDLYGQSPRSLERLMSEWNEPMFRANQLCLWIHERAECDPHRMTDLPQKLRERLAAAFPSRSFRTLRRLRSRDGTVKFVFSLHDDSTIETVLLSSGKQRAICVSTQVGCSVKCPFCASGSHGFSRNLTAGEILAQIHAVRKSVDVGMAPRNLVFMGMGEPLMNEMALHRVLDILFSPRGLGLGSRRVTVSTVGVIPAIERLCDRDPAPELALSLHASCDKVRDQLVPLNRKYPIADLLEACQRYIERAGTDMVTVEYVLLRGVNDTKRDAEALARLLKKRRFLVNLIRYNAIPGSIYEASSRETVQSFLDLLRSRGIQSTVRRSLGGEIQGGCGQLRSDLRKDLDSSLEDGTDHTRH